MYHSLLFYLLSLKMFTFLKDICQHILLHIISNYICTYYQFINPFAGIEPKIIQQKDLITFEGYIIK